MTKTIASMRIDAMGAMTPSTRASGVILGKDEPCNKNKEIVLLPDGRFMVAWSGDFVSSPRGLQIRNGQTLVLEANCVGAGRYFACHPLGHCGVAGGKLFEGYEASAKLIDLVTFSITRTLPLHGPFVWLPDGESFIAQTAHVYEGKSYVDDKLLQQEPWLSPFIGGVTRMVKVVPAQNQATLIHNFDKGLDAVVLACSLDGERVFWADYYGNVRSKAITSGQNCWSIRLKIANTEDNFSASAMALSPDGRFLAVAGSAWYGARDFVILDALNGKILLEVPLTARVSGGSRVAALAWCDNTHVVAGTAKGMLAIVALDGSIQAWKGAQACIRSIVVDHAHSRLVICGVEKQFRVWPL